MGDRPGIARFGWRTIVVPPWLSLRRRLQIVAREQPDVILLQQSRHPLNRPPFYRGIPCVFDADDADVLNAPEVRGRLLPRKPAVIAGNRFLARSSRDSMIMSTWSGPARTSIRLLGRPQPGRGPVIAWAHSDPLGYPAEAEFVRSILLRLADRRTFQFHLYGVQDRTAVGHYLKPLRDRGVDVRPTG